MNKFCTNNIIANEENIFITTFKHHCKWNRHLHYFIHNYISGYMDNHSKVWKNFYKKIFTSTSFPYQQAKVDISHNQVPPTFKTNKNLTSHQFHIYYSCLPRTIYFKFMHHKTIYIPSFNSLHIKTINQQLHAHLLLLIC